LSSDGDRPIANHHDHALLIVDDNASQSTMADSSATASVLIAATQSVAKVYVIGAIGFLAVKCTFPGAMQSHDHRTLLR
jgi:hypothetical protein